MNPETPETPAAVSAASTTSTTSTASTPSTPRVPGSRKPLIYVAAQVLARFVFGTYFPARVYGLDRIPAEGSFMLLPNHISVLDPPLVGCLVRREIHFIAKDSLFRVPVLGSILYKINGHPIRREGVDRASLKGCAAAIRAGWPMLVFPEGTRSEDGMLQPPKAGFGMLVDEAPGTPLVVALIHGTARALPRGASFPRPTRVTVAFGHPFVIEPRRADEPRREFLDRCVNELTREWAKLNAEFPQIKVTPE